MDKVVLGIVDTSRQAELALERLGMMGIAQDDVTVLHPNAAGRHDFAFERRTKAPEGALTGAAVGGLVGLLLGVLVGVGIISSPSLTALVAAGPVLSALAAAAVVAILVSIVGAFFGSGVHEIHTKHYAGKVRKGGILIAVHVADRHARHVAEEVFRTVSASELVTKRDDAPAGARPSRT